jgi:hypothetical protein
MAKARLASRSCAAVDRAAAAGLRAEPVAGVRLCAVAADDGEPATPGLRPAATTALIGS